MSSLALSKYGTQRCETLPEERPDGSGEYLCPECGRCVTRSLTGVEYGHARGRREDVRCSRRPDGVDPLPWEGRDAE